MSYVFDVSSEHNDLLEMDHQLRYCLHGDYKGCNRTDQNGHVIYNVELTDKRFALQFKLMFNATCLVWDESDDEEIVTEQDLIDRGYVEMKISIPSSRSEEFRTWCKEREFAVVDEVKFLRDGMEPMTVWVPARSGEALVQVVWGS